MTAQQPGLSSDTQAMMAYDAGKKSVAVSYLLWVFLGSLGAHRFYLGRKGSAIGMIVLNVLGWLTAIFIVGLFLLAALGIWVLVDAFLIPGWIKEHNTRLAARLGAANLDDRGPEPEAFRDA